MSQSNALARRDFIHISAMAVAMLGFPGCAMLTQHPRKPRPIAPGAKIRMAQIGCGGKGFTDIMAYSDEEVVALCDIDWEGRSSRDPATGAPRLSNVKKLIAEFPSAKRYTDFRQMLLEMDEHIDAVSIATPDHMHFLPAYMAVMLGKHVYVQKPLTQTVGEARELLRLVRLNGVCTQMGNQGHAGEGIRIIKEWCDAGVLGDVREVHIWTNRPATPGRPAADGKPAVPPQVIWPQGMKEWPKAQPPPSHLAWEHFLGRAPVRPYSPAIHPFKWRGYRDFGCGALGDMACHIMDAANWALQLGAPESVEPLKVKGLTEIAFPTSAVVRYRFPARGKLPPVQLVWYEGGELPAKPAGFPVDKELPVGGQFMVGSKATLIVGGDYGTSPRLLPEELHRKAAVSGAFPPKTIPRVPDNNPYKEWTAAIRSGNPALAGSNFEYSAPFTETVCLGTIAMLVGKTFTWNPVAMRTSLPEANRLLHPSYRTGWRPKQIFSGSAVALPASKSRP